MDDEQLLWSGCPEAFEIFDKTDKTSLIVGPVIKALVTLGILLMFYSNTGNGGEVKPGTIAFILLFAFLRSFIPSPSLGACAAGPFYGLTDKRILRSGANDEAVPYDRIKRTVLRADLDGRTTLLCSPRACDLKARQWRGEADDAFINSNDAPEAERVILYALPMDHTFQELLKKYLPLE